jgi:hypothetical protein
MMLWRVLGVTLLLCGPARAADNLLVNGDFEQALDGWAKGWSRSGQIDVTVDAKIVHGGQGAVRIQHHGDCDWSLAQRRECRVTAGEIYELAGWARVDGDGRVSLSVTLYDAQHHASQWTYGQRSVQGSGGPGDWRALAGRFVIPPGTIAMLPRWTGFGSVTAWLDDVVLRRSGAVDAEASKRLPAQLSVRNAALEVTLRPADATLAIRDLRSGRTWRQYPTAGCCVLAARGVPQGFDLRLLDLAAVSEVQVAVRLDAQRPEVAVELSGQGELTAPLGFPQPFASPEKGLLIMPVNEGMSYPVDDATLRPMHYYLYGGHGLSMGWYGLTDGQAGLMTLVETPDDAAVAVPRHEGRLQAAPQWEPQRGQFGPPRRMRYVLFDEGGYVAMCKRYRDYSRQIGLLKTLAEKRRENPHVDKLIGAVNVWSFCPDPVATCREMQSLGMTRLLWSSVQKPRDIDAINALGALSSRYDIYQDCMNPANFPKLRGLHGDWTTEAWPNDLMLDAAGHWIHGWAVYGKGGERYDCGVLCDRLAPDYARRRMLPELKARHYEGRFIDTTTASPWRECYDPRHPLSRSESKHWKMELLRVVSEEFKLVTGSETGHEAAVPYLHFFEGMMSLGPYRVRDAGRKMAEILDEVPEQVAKFQTGPYYRLPLWELVYHDCVVSYWYWGDYNNKLPAVWDRRDLWNALYGTPPMFMFTPKVWQANRQRFVQSYQTATPVARATGYSEMLSHRWLTADHAVQETAFADGTRVTVNFGETAYRMPDGGQLAPGKDRVTSRAERPADR